MITVSNDFKTAVKSGGRTARSYIEVLMPPAPGVFYPGQIYPNQFAAEDTINDTDYLSEWKIGDVVNIGKTSMRSITIKTLEGYDLENKETKIYAGITLPSDTVEYISLGNFVITKPKTSNSGLEATFEGYDYMWYTQKEYETNLTLPTTALAIVQEICINCGIELGNTDFHNYDLAITKMPDTTNLTSRDVLKWVAELSMTYAKIRNDNKLYLDTFEDSGETVTADHYYDLTLENKYGPVNSLYLKSYKQNDTVSVKNDSSILSNGETKFQITGNELLEGIRADVVDDMFAEIDGLEYYPFEANWMCWLYLETGDNITLDDVDGNSVSTAILEQEIKFNGALSGTIRTEANTTTETEYGGNSNLSNIEARKVGSDEIISKINVSPESIVIQANKISLAGKTIDLTADTIEIDSTNFSVDSDGNMTANNGTFSGDIILTGSTSKIIGSDGVLTNLQYVSQGNFLGQTFETYSGEHFVKNQLTFNVNIPSDFVISSAILTVDIFKTENVFAIGESYGNAYGKVQNIKLYTQALSAEYTNTVNELFEYDGTYTEITGAFGTSGYTTTVTTKEDFSSVDIKSSLATGLTQLVVQTGDALLSVQGLSGTDYEDEITAGAEQTQFASGVLNIIGYKKI